MSPCHTFMENLRAKGYRITPQREIIIQTIAHAPTHLSAEQIYEQVQQHTKALNLATIYRTLDTLVEEGLACKNDLGGGTIVYTTHHHGPHIHLVCRHCGQVIEADYALIEPLDDQFREQFGFSADLQHLSIFGLCAPCQEGADPT